MMTYYIKDTGAEVFPYDTEDNAARSLNRLTKQLQWYTYNDINQLVTDSGYGMLPINMGVMWQYIM